MVDERRLAAIRRYWTREQVDDAYQKILAIDWTTTEKKVIIVGKSNEGESSNAQVVVTREDFAQWMDIFEARLVELDAEAAGTPATHQNVEHVRFNHRYAAS
jgi:GTP-binding protein EngB required for normal cell division